MGGFCSKMEETTEPVSKTNNNTSIANNNRVGTNQQNGDPLPVDDDGEADTDEFNPASSFDNTTTTTKKRKGFASSLLFRVGSRDNLLHPNSPTRAANYNHVHDAVAINFRGVVNNSNTNNDGINNGAGGGSSTAAAGSRSNSATTIPLGVIGFRNLGNTCFLNSSLQCLSATIPLTDYFLAYQYKQEINHKNPLGTGGKLVVEYAELVKLIWLRNNNTNNTNNINNTVIRPIAFKTQLERFAPQFRGYRQHDSQELLAYLLDGIHEDLNRIQTKPYIEDRDCDGTTDELDAIEAWKNYLRRDKSLIVDIFQGQMRSKLQCLTCGHSNIRFEAFMYLSLPMSSKCRTVSDCLELYLAEETMVGNNQWYCGKCKTHRDATKKTDLWILPPILIIHLKRFNFNEYGHLGSKNTAPVDYPILDWDLSQYVCSQGSERPLYDCYAVSNHIGGLHGGHYTAYTQNRFNDQWYEFNDSSYHRVNASELRRNSSSAYVLFYNRSQNQPTGSGDNRTDVASSFIQVGGAAGRAMPLIRRQSESRPELWPHTQVQDSHFRDFSRQSTRKPTTVPLPFLVESSGNGKSSNIGDSSIAVGKNEDISYGD